MEIEDLIVDSQVSVGARLKFVRRHAGRSQADVADMIGVGQSHYSQMELGRWMPGEPYMSRYCAIFGVTERFVRLGDVRGIQRDLATLYEISGLIDIHEKAYRKACKI